VKIREISGQKMEKSSKIYVAGHTGMVGSAIVRKLKAERYNNLVLRTHKELDLLNQAAVNKFFQQEKPEYVFIAAAKVGGILANNTYRAQFIYENLQIQNNLIHFAHVYGVKKLLFIGSSCIYPKMAPQPIKEEYLLTGPLEYTNEPYALAKIVGIKLCENYYKQYRSNFISVMPTNLYGPNDNFDLKTAHSLPAMIRKFHEAKIYNKRDVTIWGTGKVYREFMYVDDLADAVVYLMNVLSPDYLYDEGITHINIGLGKDVTIYELALLIKEVIGFKGDIKFDKSKPDGTPRKLLDVSRLNKIGWRYNIELRDGIKQTYDWFRENFYNKYE